MPASRSSAPSRGRTKRASESGVAVVGLEGPLELRLDDCGRAIVTVRFSVEASAGAPVARQPAGSSSGRSSLAPARSADGTRRRSHVTFKWPAEAVAEIGTAHRRLRRDYGSPFAGEGAPSRELTQSALLAGALAEAMARPARWLSAVRDDGRGRGGRASASGHADERKVSVVLTPGLRQQWTDFVDDVSENAGRIWGPGFRPTRQNLALAAVQHQLPAAESWLPRRVA